jgi:polyphosphate glucokinase
MERVGLGIDIGGTGTKAALVDLETGALLSERVRVPTPRPATLDTLTKAVVELTRPLMTDDIQAVGLGFPAVVRRGVALSAVNVGAEWLYADLGQIFGEALGRSVWAVNDSDGAGLAEARWGAGRHHDGTILVMTLGTGVGTSLVMDGHLIPNIELGCLPVRGKPAGERVANSVRRARGLSWKEWSSDLQAFIDAVDEAVAPDLVIIGGGVSKDAHRFVGRIRTRPLVLPARLQNRAGIIGAALFADDQERSRSAATAGKISQLTPVAADAS